MPRPHEIRHRDYVGGYIYRRRSLGASGIAVPAGAANRCPPSNRRVAQPSFRQARRKRWRRRARRGSSLCLYLWATFGIGLEQRMGPNFSFRSRVKLGLTADMPLLASCVEKRTKAFRVLAPSDAGFGPPETHSLRWRRRAN